MSGSLEFRANLRAAALSYPDNGPERDRWILSRRTSRNPVDPQRPYAFLLEEEPSETREIVSIATIFLTNRECPWRCLMCDLWRNTITESLPAGAIPAQIDYALNELSVTRHRDSSQAPPAIEPGNQSTWRCGGVPTKQPRQIKLYNSGSFFDPRAIPIEDYEAIASRVAPFERTIVECHPALVNDTCLRFHDRLAKNSDRALRKLEVALGLETVHSEVLAKLNKRMTLDHFTRAAEFLSKNQIAMRAFILVKPPFLDEAEGIHWAKCSLNFAFESGASVASLIPTRVGNGALDQLAQEGRFSPPKLSSLESAFAYGLNLKRGRVLADLWDLEKFSNCSACFPRRSERLRTMNLAQTVLPPIACSECDGAK